MAIRFFHLLLAIALPAFIVCAIMLYGQGSIPWVNVSGFDPASGAKIFGARCARCHNFDSQSYVKFGPSLQGLANRQVPSGSSCQDLPTYVLTSILNPDEYHVPGYGSMPRNLIVDLEPAEVKNLIYYLLGKRHRDLTAKLQIPIQKKVDTIPPITFEEAELGRMVFFEKGGCIQCHSHYQAPEHHVFAPNLFQIGFQDYKQVCEQIVHPSRTIANAYRQVTVVTTDGKSVTGRPLPTKPDRGLRLMTRDKDGTFSIVTIPNEDIDVEDGHPCIRALDISPMPDDYGKTLTPAEIEAVAKLIVALNDQTR